MRPPGNASLAANGVDLGRSPGAGPAVGLMTNLAATKLMSALGQTGLDEPETGLPKYSSDTADLFLGILPSSPIGSRLSYHRLFWPAWATYCPALIYLTSVLSQPPRLFPLCKRDLTSLAVPCPQTVIDPRERDALRNARPVWAADDHSRRHAVSILYLVWYAGLLRHHSSSRLRDKRC